MFGKIFCVTILFSSWALALPVPRFMTNEEELRYDPEAQGITDDASVGQFVQDFLLANSDFLVSDAAFERSLRESKAGADVADRLKAQRRQVLEESRRLLGRLRGTVGTTREQMLGVCEERPSNLIAAMVRRVDEDREAEDCANIPLKVGGVVKFKHQGRLQTPMLHTLKRLSEKKYQAILNLNVHDVSNISNGPATFEKIRTCMKAVSPYLKGPDGKELEVKIMDPASVSLLPEEERPNPVEITVASESEKRGNAMTYRNSWDCDTITHEILHLLGLCDEYHESWEYSARWSCRVVPEGVSQMADFTKIFNQVVPKATFCECTTSICRGALSIPQETLDSNAASSSPCDTVSGRLEGSTYDPGRIPSTTTLEGNRLTFVTRPTMKSLITDVHFTKIISGYCAREAPGYAKCSQYSQIAAEDPRCAEKPVECSNSEYYRGTSR